MKRQTKLLIGLGVAVALFLASRTKVGQGVIESTTNKLAALLLKEEGRVLTAYKDTGGVWTIGDGHKILPGEGIYPYGSKRTITAAEADALRDKDMGLALKVVRDYVVVPLKENQLLALASLAYNIGRSAFATSTLVKLLNNSDFAGAAAQFGRWIYDNGKVDKVLVARRARETALFQSA